jgi:hypothetical protein
MKSKSDSLKSDIFMTKVGHKLTLYLHNFFIDSFSDYKSRLLNELIICYFIEQKDLLLLLLISILMLKIEIKFVLV